MAILRIKEIMLQKGVSRIVLAGKVKVTETTISNICSEKFHPKMDLLVKLAKALDVDIRELFIPTKGGVITGSELNEASDYIAKGLKILNGRKK